MKWAGKNILNVLRIPFVVAGLILFIVFSSKAAADADSIVAVGGKPLLRSVTSTMDILNLISVGPIGIQGSTNRVESTKIRTVQPAVSSASPKKIEVISNQTTGQATDLPGNQTPQPIKDSLDNSLLPIKVQPTPGNSNLVPKKPNTSLDSTLKNVKDTVPVKVDTKLDLYLPF